jgi:hypothetical protein
MLKRLLQCRGQTLAGQPGRESIREEQDLRKSILACVAVALIAGATSATAATLITGKQIKNGTITAEDIKRGSINASRLSSRLRDRLSPVGAQGTPALPGAKGDPGPKGDKGDKGDPGDPGPKHSSGNWGVINRNTIHSPTVELRSGPFDAPVGDGSLNIAVADGTEKAAYGNEVDFAGKPLELTAVGFHVFTTGENNAAPADNMPSIAFEIDPNLAAGKPQNDYTSLVFMPAKTASNAWSGYIDATTTGLWGLTGSAFNATPCSINGARCTFDQVMAYLNDGGAQATIYTAGVSKGRDYEFHGAVDGLRINDTVFDFEEDGVSATRP